MLHKKEGRKATTIPKIATYLCPTLIVKESKISVEQGNVVTTFNIIKH